MITITRGARLRAAAASVVVVALGLTGCQPRVPPCEGEECFEPPPPLCEGDECKTPPPPSAKAVAEFKALVQQYKNATAGDKTLDKAQCERLAGGFTALYKKHGAGMAVAQFNAGAVWEGCGDLDRAASIYRGLTKAAPGFDLAYNNLGVIEWQRGKTKAARALFRQAVDRKPLQAMAARNNVAALARDAYVRTTDTQAFQEAERAIQQVLALDSSNQQAYENLARLYYDRGSLRDRSYIMLAELVVQQGLRVMKEEGKESADLMNVKGLLLLSRDDQVSALRAFEEAVRIESKHVEANLNIAFIAIRFRDYNRAATAFAVAMQDKGKRASAEIQNGYGVALRGQRKFEAAEKAYREAARLDPRDPRPIFNLGVLTQSHIATSGDVTKDKTRKYFKRARKHFEKFIDLATGDKRFATEVLDAKDRIAGIDETLEFLDISDQVEAQAAKIEAQQRAAEKAERERLLEMERRALERGGDAASGGSDRS